MAMTDKAVDRVRLRSGVQIINGVTGETGPVYSEYVLAEHYDALRDKNDVLRAENTRLRDEVSDLDALRVRVAELEADAARYRWLRDHANEAWVQWADEREDSTSADIDAAIDRARDVPSAGGGHSHKPTCKECGQFLDARGKCRVSEHNS